MLMKKTVLISLAVLALLVVAGLLWKSKGTNAAAETAQGPAPAPAAAIQAQPASGAPAQLAAENYSGDGIKWITWDEAVKANEQDPKLLFIDVYTDWCGWCKVMDRKTFTDPQVIKHINDNYYAVKFNAESEPPVSFRGQEFKVVEGGRRGIHTLAYALLDGELSYPSCVYLNSEFQRVTISKGFKEAEPFLAELESVTKAVLQ